MESEFGFGNSFWCVRIRIYCMCSHTNTNIRIIGGIGLISSCIISISCHLATTQQSLSMSEIKTYTPLPMVQIISFRRLYSLQSDEFNKIYYARKCKGATFVEAIEAITTDLNNPSTYTHTYKKNRLYSINIASVMTSSHVEVPSFQAFL